MSGGAVGPGPPYHHQHALLTRADKPACSLHRRLSTKHAGTSGAQSGAQAPRQARNADAACTGRQRPARGWSWDTLSARARLHGQVARGRHVGRRRVGGQVADAAAAAPAVGAAAARGCQRGQRGVVHLAQQVLLVLLLLAPARARAGLGLLTY